MKTLLTVVIAALLLSSCSKEMEFVPILKKQKDVLKLSLVTVYGVQQRDYNYATITRNDSVIVGTWRWFFDFRNPNEETANINFNVNDDIYGDPVGEIIFKCHLFGSTLTDYTYTGKGSWYIYSATGVLKGFGKGAGDLTYKEILGEEDTNSTEYQINMEGYGKR